MDDRIASKPGRVLVEPENGSGSFYAKLSMADEPTQEGDAPVKKNLLTDATAEMLTLPPSATVNDALFFASKAVRWHTLADVTLPEEAQGVVIPLVRDFTEHSSLIMIIFTSKGSTQIAPYLYTGTDTSGVQLATWSVGYNQVQGMAQQTIFPIAGKGKVNLNLVSFDGEDTENVYLYGSNRAFPAGTRFVMLGR